MLLTVRIHYRCPGKARANIESMIVITPNPICTPLTHPGASPDDNK